MVRSPTTPPWARPVTPARVVPRCRRLPARPTRRPPACRRHPPSRRRLRGRRRSPPAAGWGTVPPDSGRFAVPGAPGLVYAGAGPRLVAYIIDAVLVGIVVSIITLPFAANALTESLSGSGAFDPANPVPMMAPVAGISTIIALVIEAAYFTLLWASGGRATHRDAPAQAPGRRRHERQPDPDRTAFRRWLGFGAWLNLIAFVPVLGAFASLAVFAWQVVLLVTTANHPQKMGLHDRFANTAMVRPANAGNAAGIVIGCLLIVVAVAVLSIVALIFLGPPGVGDPVRGRGVGLTDGGGRHGSDRRGPAHRPPRHGPGARSGRPPTRSST